MKKSFLFLPLLLAMLSSYAAPVITVDTVAPAFQDKHIMVITLKKELRPGSEVTDAAKTWKLTSSQAMEIFKSVKPVSDAELAAKFTESPAFMSGKCRVDDKNYTYEINAGDFLTLNDGQQLTHYACYNKSLRKYFLTGPK